MNTDSHDPTDDLRHEIEHDEPRDGAARAEDRIAQLEEELRESNQRGLRAVADLQNYVKRSLQNEQVARQRGIASVVHGIVGVIDHFDLALNHEASSSSSQQFVEGVRVIRDELVKALGAAGVRTIQPVPNEEFKPGVHEAILQKEVEGVEPGNVSMVFQPGYQLGDHVIRAAKVAVAPT